MTTTEQTQYGAAYALPCGLTDDHPVLVYALEYAVRSLTRQLRAAGIEGPHLGWTWTVVHPALVSEPFFPYIPAIRVEVVV